MNTNWRPVQGCNPSAAPSPAAGVDRVHLRHDDRIRMVNKMYGLLPNAMDSTNWRLVQGCNPSAGVEQNAPAIASGDWRAQIKPEARTRIVNKMLETMKKHLPEPQRLNELRSLAVRYERKFYDVAVNQSDYLRKVSLKMLSMEAGTRQAPGNAQVIPNQNNPGQGLLR